MKYAAGFAALHRKIEKYSPTPARSCAQARKESTGAREATSAARLRGQKPSFHRGVRHEAQSSSSFVAYRRRNCNCESSLLSRPLDNTPSHNSISPTPTYTPQSKTPYLSSYLKVSLEVVKLPDSPKLPTEPNKEHADFMTTLQTYSHRLALHNAPMNPAYSATFMKTKKPSSSST